MFDVFSISSSGMEAQRLRMNIIAGNLANAETTRTLEGGAYRRKDVLFSTDNNNFGSYLNASFDTMAQGVKVAAVIQDQRPLKHVFDPKHPDANNDGYVAYPNVNVAEEMVNMISAARSYEANITAFKAAKEMAYKALEITQ